MFGSYLTLRKNVEVVAEEQVEKVSKMPWTEKYAPLALKSWISDYHGGGYCPICNYHYQRLSSHYRGCLSKADIIERERLLAIEQGELFRKAKKDLNGSSNSFVQ